MIRLFAFFLCLVWLSLPWRLHSQEEGPRELFLKAYTLFSQGNTSQAEELFLKTLDRGSLLEDYSLYFLGQISISRSDLESSRRYFTRLKQAFPQSVWSLPADLGLAKILLAEKNYQRAVEELRALQIRASKREISDEILYLLGQIHENEGSWQQAYSVYQELRRASPLSPWAAKAKTEVRRLREQYPHLFGLTTAESLTVEGELLLREREYQEAEKVYRQLLDRLPPVGLRPRFLMALANVYQAARKREEAIPVLLEVMRQYPESPEAPAALHRLANTRWNRDENLKALDHFKQLQERYPQSPFIDSAQFASARIYESLGRVDEARRIYRDFPKKFPSSRWREEATWRLAWSHYLHGDQSAAYGMFQLIAKDNGNGQYRVGALYWQARSAEKIGRLEEAKRIYTRILKEYEESYYAGLAARAMERIGAPVEESPQANVAILPEPASAVDPDYSFHLARAQALTDIFLNQLAVAELDSIKTRGHLTVRLTLMREYARNQAYASSLALANQAPPIEEAIRHRFPLAYWETVRKIAGEKDLDPYLVVALIRQESLFDPKALSPASAHGLMQLLPSTAVRVAQQLGLPPPQPKELFEADLNLALGTYYLKELLQRYSDNLVKAIAAYNAGENALARWEKEIPAEDEEEFIERIPYGETRLYVKLVLRNHRIYRRLYNNPK